MTMERLESKLCEEDIPSMPLFIEGVIGQSSPNFKDLISRLEVLLGSLDSVRTEVVDGKIPLMKVEALLMEGKKDWLVLDYLIRSLPSHKGYNLAGIILSDIPYISDFSQKSSQRFFFEASRYASNNEDKSYALSNQAAKNYIDGYSVLLSPISSMPAKIKAKFADAH